MPPRRNLAVHAFTGTAVLLLAACLRLYSFGDAPPGLQHDEIFKAQEGRALINQGDFRLFYPTNQGHEGLFVWVLGVSYTLFGASVMMLKFPALVSGMLTVALTYRVWGEVFNRRTAWIAAGLTAVSFWSVSVSRVGLRANLLPVVALLVVWGLWRVIRPVSSGGSPPRLIVLLTGVALGLAIYTYTSAFVLYLAFAGLVLLLALVQRAFFRRTWRSLLLIGVIGAGLALPMIYIRLTDPQGANRVSTINRPLTDLLAGKPDELIGNAWGLVGMPAFTGDPEWRYNVAGRPLFVLPVGLLVYAGFGLALWRVRRQPLLTLPLLFATLGVIPSLLTVSAPSYLRSILALPAVMLFVALAVDALPAKRLVPALGLAIIAITGLADSAAYFGTWTQNEEVQQIYRDDLEQLAGYLRANPATRALVSTPDTALDPTLFGYYQPPDSARVAFFDGGTAIALSTEPALLFISPFSPITPPHADWLTAAGTVALPPLYRQDGEIAFNVYELHPADSLPARLTQVQAQPVYIYPEASFPRGRVSTWAETIPYPVNFGNIVQLVGVELPRRQIATERDGVNLQLYWQPLVAGVDLPLNVFVHLARTDGTVHAQRDLLSVPTRQWQPDLVWIQDNFVVAGPTPPGRYILTLGVYNYVTGERLPVLDAAGHPIADRLLLDRITAG